MNGSRSVPRASMTTTTGNISGNNSFPSIPMPTTGAYAYRGRPSVSATSTTTVRPPTAPATSSPPASSTAPSSSSSSTSSCIWDWNADTIGGWIHGEIESTLTAAVTKVLGDKNEFPPLNQNSDHAQRIFRSYTQRVVEGLKGASDNEQKDPLNLLDESFSRGGDSQHSAGAVLCRSSEHTWTKLLPPFSEDKVLTKRTWVAYVRALLRAVAAHIEMDLLKSTPRRIVEMLCPELGLSEVENIRKRVHQTVVLGKGTHSSANAAMLEGEEDLPVAARVAQHDIDKFKKCATCGNNDQSNFILDKKNGDLICTLCGTVAKESLLHEGSAYRKFEGEVDRNHHGDAANPLFSGAHNMGTSLSTVAMPSGPAPSGEAAQNHRGFDKILKHTHTFTEMNLSQYNRKEKNTRVGYKDRQKKDAFVRMTHVGDALGLHEAVVQYAKVLFAGFRDDRELVQQFQGVLAACLWESFDRLSSDGRQILQQQQQTIEDSDEEDDYLDDTAQKKKRGRRAGWRNEMHKVSLADKTLLDEVKPSSNTAAATATAAPTNTAATTTPSELATLEDKDIMKWNMDDCRTWLVETSKTIAQRWADKPSVGPTQQQNMPKPSKDELTGRLLTHTLAVCDRLETELASPQINPKKKSIDVKTPRVKDMARLGIRWQHADERGSGGKGGVGNSGQRRPLAGGKKPDPADNQKSAGQTLLLWTPAQWTLSDKDAGVAFHSALRRLCSVQSTQKKKRKSYDSAQRRCQQLKRKPWLSTRAQSS